MIENKKILFITDSCPPNLTMSGIVVKNIIDSLSNSNKCDIVAVMQGDNDVPEYNGIKVHYVKSFPYHILNNRRKMVNASSGIGRAWYKTVVLFFRLLSIFTRFISSLGINVVTTRKLKKAISEVLKNETYDYVLCNAKPFESFEAVYSLIGKYKSTTFIAYQTDDFVTAGDERYIPKFLQDKKLKNRVRRLNDYVETFDVYGMLESIYLKEIGSVTSRERVTKLGIPLLYNRSASGSSVSDSGKLNFVYAGSLVKSFRPADDCLGVMMEVAKLVDLTMDVYHRGDCYDVIDEYSRRSSGVIHNRGEVSATESYAAISNADVLISISNVDGDQISGKTFDYMSTCKPIIHFYYKDDDMNASVFDRYTYGLSIHVGGTDVKENVERIAEFVNKTRGVSVTYSDVEKEFKQYTVGEVVNSLFVEDKKAR